MKVEVKAIDAKDEKTAEYLSRHLTGELQKTEPCLLCGHQKSCHTPSGCSLCYSTSDPHEFLGIWEQL